MNPFSKRLVLLAALFVCGGGDCVKAAPLATNAPASIELHDQYDRPQKLAFPTSDITLLTIADRKGSEQINGWITLLKPRYRGRVDIRGLADLGGAPWFVQGKIRKRFQETCAYPVMMDWSGKVCAQFNYQPGLANVLVLDGDGIIQGRFAGPAEGARVEQAFAILDKLLEGRKGTSAKSAGNRPAGSTK